MVDDAGELLPQTEDEPSIHSPLFQHRLGLLWQAIVADDPEIARPFFFPKVAYLKVKAIKDPPAATGSAGCGSSSCATFTSTTKSSAPIRARPASSGSDFPEGKSHWMKKHKEGNAIGYHRVKRPYLVFTDADGKEQKLEVTVMISWRGEWYVVHLHGFE